MATYDEKLVRGQQLAYAISKLKTITDAKVDKETGKGLSTNDYTTAEKTKLAGLENTTVVDNLTSTSPTSALSANQGKTLDEKIKALSDSMSDLGYGDMLKATYDTNKDGVVDNSSALEGHPASYFAIATDLDEKVDKETGKGLSTNDYTTAEKTKLAGIEEKAEVNQDAFSNFLVGNITVAADTKKDTVTFVAGNNVTLTADATADSITFAAKDTTYSEATSTKGGLLTDAQAVKLAGLEDGANKTTVVDNLTSESSTAALSAKQGKQLESEIDALETNKANKTDVPSKLSDLTDDINAANVIETVKVDGTALTVTAKAVNIDLSKKADKADVTALTSRVSTNEGDISDIKEKLTTIEENADANVIETIKVNSTALTPDASKAVNISVPTKISDLTDDVDAANKINSIKVNGSTQTITSKIVDIKVPTTVAELTDAENYALKSDLTNVYIYKGSVTDLTALNALTGQTTGWVYNVEDTGMNYAWNGSAWDNLGTIYTFEYVTNSDVDTMFA